VQLKTPDDGQRNCPKHVEFYSKNKFKKLVLLVRFIIRNVGVWKFALIQLFGSQICLYVLTLIMRKASQGIASAWIADVTEIWKNFVKLFIQTHNDCHNKLLFFKHLLTIWRYFNYINPKINNARVSLNIKTLVWMTESHPRCLGYWVTRLFDRNLPSKIKQSCSVWRTNWQQGKR